MKYAFYGTLRRGMSNFQPFQADLSYIRTVKIAGFRMYSRGPYPYVVATPNASEVITAELFEITSAATEKNIDQLELGAGYFLGHVVIDSQKFGIYQFKQNIVGDPQILSGDWAVFVSSDRV